MMWRHYLFALAIVLAAAGQAATHAEPFTFGVTPQKPASKLAEEWTPVIAEIGRRAGVELSFRTAPNVPAFGERLAAGEYDIAYVNPYQYTVVSQQPGYRAFAREKGRPLVGIVIVRKDSPLRDLKDLQGRTVIFPTPLAFAASMLTQAVMHDLGIHVQARYVQSHDSVLSGVANGAYEAGGTIARVLDSAPASVAASLRVLASTPEYRPHPFVAHPRVPAATLKKLRRLPQPGAGRGGARPPRTSGVQGHRACQGQGLRQHPAPRHARPDRIGAIR